MPLTSPFAICCQKMAQVLMAPSCARRRTRSACHARRASPSVRPRVRDDLTALDLDDVAGDEALADLVEGHRPEHRVPLALTDLFRDLVVIRAAAGLVHAVGDDFQA